MTCRARKVPCRQGMHDTHTMHHAWYRSHSTTLQCHQEMNPNAYVKSESGAVPGGGAASGGGVIPGGGAVSGGGVIPGGGAASGGGVIPGGGAASGGSEPSEHVVPVAGRKRGRPRKNPESGAGGSGGSPLGAGNPPATRTLSTRESKLPIRFEPSGELGHNSRSKYLKI